MEISKKSIKNIENELKVRFLNEDLRRKRLETRSRFLFQSTITISILFTVLFSSLLLINPSDRKDVFLFPFVARSSIDLAEINNLKTQITLLQSNIGQLENELKAIKNLSGEDKDTIIIDGEINSLKENINNLSDTILENPETAITAKLLREKQTSSDQKVDNLIKDQQRLEDKVDGFLSNLIAVPIFAALAGLVFTIIAAVVTPVLTKLKDKIFGTSDKDIANEAV